MFFELLWMMKNSQLLTTKCRWISRTCPIAHIDRTIKENEELCDEARMDEKKDVAYSLADRKMSVEDISEIIKVNIETVRGWLAGRTPVKK